MDGFKVGGKLLGITFLMASALVGLAAPESAAAAPRNKQTFVAPLKISGTPATTDVAGTLYSFTPSASGGGSTKSFAISNKPTWASFSIATGTISGTPTTTQVGTYANVTITVTDGVTAASLAPFSITVTAPAPAPVVGSATLTWTAPSQNTDGSTLADLAGYNVYYGTSPTSLTNKIAIANPGATNYTVGNLGSGTYYFAVSAYNVSGIESTPSNIGSKTIN